MCNIDKNSTRRKMSYWSIFTPCHNYSQCVKNPVLEVLETRCMHVCDLFIVR